MDKCMEQYFIFGDEFKKSEEFDSYISDKGKSLYEVIRVSDGIPIFLKQHLDRLENSAKIMKYKVTITRNEIVDGIIKLIKENKVSNGNLKLVINYNPDGENLCKDGNIQSYDCGFNEKFLVYFIKHSYPTNQQYSEGVKTIIYHGERSNPNAKVINNVFRENVNLKIKNKNVYEAILVDNGGYITEGSKSNIFMVKEEAVVTSRVKNVLPGITRQFIIKTCEKLNIKFIEKDVLEKDLKSYTGLFISGTSPKVLPIESVDGFSFNSSNNSIIKAIMLGFDDELKEDKQKFVKFISNRTINK